MRLQHAPRLARHGGTRVDQLDVGAKQAAQIVLGEDVVGAAQHQRVHFAGLEAEGAQRRHVPVAQGVDFAVLPMDRGGQLGAFFDGARQAVAGLHLEARALAVF